MTARLRKRFSRLIQRDMTRTLSKNHQAIASKRMSNSPASQIKIKSRSSVKTGGQNHFLISWNSLSTQSKALPTNSRNHWSNIKESASLPTTIYSCLRASQSSYGLTTTRSLRWKTDWRPSKRSKVSPRITLMSLYSTSACQ